MKKHWALSYPFSAQRRLIRLGGCPGWSESSLGAHLYFGFVMSWLISISSPAHQLDSKYLSPLVFDPLFYINDNPDLIRSGIDTKSEADHHWLTSGAGEGRQGCGSFHSKQYLQRWLLSIHFAVVQEQHPGGVTPCILYGTDVPLE